MSYRVIRPEEADWEERPTEQGAVRRVLDVTAAGALERSRARIWRYPPRSRGRRHREGVQEEVFVVLDGTLTMLLGDPPERVDLAPRSVVAVAPGTPLQVRNESEAEVVVLAYGAPPVAGRAEYLEDVELP